MILKVVIDDQLIELNVPGEFLAKAQDFFAKMDADMDQGWQVNREWVEKPDRLLRAQIAANKLFTALENEDHKLGRLMAGYILSRVPDVESVELKPAGETRDHQINLAQQTTSPAASQATESIAHAGIPRGLNKMQAMTQAAKDVSKVFKMGRQYRFSVYNHATQAWEESPAIADKQQAEAMREHAFKARFDALTE
jgi:DNA-directed RNA polymerase subunit L